SGQEEFNAAREMLRGDHRQRDLTKAVDLLWAGVRKGYVPAEVTLADLYRRGDGVPKSCDQAQVLLVAASKKGSPEARQKLEQMAEEACSDWLRAREKLPPEIPLRFMSTADPALREKSGRAISVRRRSRFPCPGRERPSESPPAGATGRSSARRE